MRKTVKKWGHSLVIVFNSEEQKIYNIGLGDIIDIDIIKKGGENNGSRTKKES